MRYLSIVCLLLAACAPLTISTLAPTTQVSASATLPPTLPPTLTSTPTLVPTSTPSDGVGTIGLDFIALLCNADWMNGAHRLTPCPAPGADVSGGYAARLDPASEGLPAGTPILQVVPNANALFLRYPTFAVRAGDRFRTRLLCRTSAPCDVQFALEYYDASNKYHDSFMVWNYRTGDTPIEVDSDLSALAGQSVDFVLALRLFHNIQSPDQDHGLWIAPHIYRPAP